MRRVALIFAFAAVLLCACEKKRPNGDPKVTFPVESIMASPGDAVKVEGTVNDPAGIAHIDLSIAAFGFSKSMSLVGSYPNEYEFSAEFTIPSDAASGSDFVVTALSYDNKSVTAKLPIELRKDNS